MKTEVLIRPPKTIMELYRALPEGTLAELMDNAIYMSPSPSSDHQRVLNKINNQLFNHFEATQTGEVFIAPFDIYFDNESNVVQPDIIVILKGNDIIKPDGYAHGVPDLLIEILSPGNRDHDLVKKKNLYEKFGVKEYWIVDPTSKHCLGFVLSNSKYNLISENTGEIFLQLLQMKITF